MFFPNVQYLYKFKPCVLTDLQVTYDGEAQTPAFYRAIDATGNNPPESLIINTSWTELEYWVRSDYGSVQDDLPTNDPTDASFWYNLSGAQAPTFSGGPGNLFG